MMILLLNDRQQQAVDWLLDAEHDQWLFFQPVLTSPVYAEFRTNPQVTEALSRMVNWRAGLLDELLASGLPEVEDPSLLLELIESLVTPTHHERALVALHFDDDPAEALQYYEQALSKDSGNAVIIRQMADLVLNYGLVDESIRLNERAVSLAPLHSETHYQLGFSYACAHRWNDAISSLRRSLELNPGDSPTQRMLGMVLILNGEPRAAMDLIQQIENDFQRIMGLVLAHFALGEEDESDVLMAELIEVAQGRAPFQIAYLFAFRDDPDLAFDWLQKAVTMGRLRPDAAVYPMLDKLHDDPRWLPFLESIGKSPQQLAEIEFNLKLPW